MKLHSSPIAPNPVRVELYCAEKRAGGCDLGMERVLVNLREGEQNEATHTARNPFKRLPVLELDDGSFLIESLVIMEYLEELHPEPCMIGRTPLERAHVRELERIAEQGVLQQIARLIHATRSPLGLPPSADIAEAARRVMPNSLKYLDDQLADGRQFLAGSKPTIADCTLAAGLQFGRFGKVPLDTKYQNLARWDAAYREREPAKDVLDM